MLQRAIQYLPTVVSLSKNTFIRSLSTSLKTFGIACDIDGVLLKGKQLIPRSDDAIRFLQDKKIPFCFMTNGGGLLESDRIHFLEEKLHTHLDPNQIIQSHTPMQELLSQYRNKKILVLGSKQYLEVSQHYGFAKGITPQEFLALHPEYYPPKHYSVTNERKQVLLTYDDEPCVAILVLHDPIDWASEIQICMDVLTTPSERKNTISSSPSPIQSVPIYVGNPDLLYSGVCKQPRLACRAFVEALNGVFFSEYHTNLNIHYYGKPNKIVYDYAEKTINNMSQLLYPSSSIHIDRYYGIGDNPHSDIVGANQAGPLWNSVYVKTGSLAPPKLNTNECPKYTYSDVFEAVQEIYKMNYQ
ncbi:hypothetical protein WA158_002537 [Blastocystis sp. Blastoise]